MCGNLAGCDLSDVDHISLAAVTIEPLAFARVIDDILRQSLADNEANQRFAAIVDRFMRGSSGGQPNEIARSNLMSLIADNFRAASPRDLSSRIAAEFSW